MEEFGPDEWREGILLTPAQQFATLSDCPVYCFCFVTKMEQNVATSEGWARSSEFTRCQSIVPSPCIVLLKRAARAIFQSSPPPSFDIAMMIRLI